MPKPFHSALLLKGLVLSFVISFVMTLLLAMIYYFTSLEESNLYSNIILGCGVFVGSAYSSLQAGSKGLINGLIIGASFFLCSMIIYYIFTSGNLGWYDIFKRVLLSLSTGAVGGILGVVLSK